MPLRNIPANCRFKKANSSAFMRVFQDAGWEAALPLNRNKSDWDSRQRGYRSADAHIRDAAGRNEPARMQASALL